VFLSGGSLYTEGFHLSNFCTFCFRPCLGVGAPSSSMAVTSSSTIASPSCVEAHECFDSGAGLRAVRGGGGDTEGNERASIEQDGVADATSQRSSAQLRVSKAKTIPPSPNACALAHSKQITSVARTWLMAAAETACEGR